MSDASSAGSLLDHLSGPWAIAGTIAAACAYAVAQAYFNHRKPEARAALAQENPPGSSPVPTWALYGPVHEVMQTIHDMAEEHRKQTTILQDIAKILDATDRGQAYTHKVLEMTLLNQEMREDYVAPSASQQVRTKHETEAARRSSDNDTDRRRDHRS